MTIDGKYCLEHARRMDEHERRINRLDAAGERLKGTLYGHNSTLGILARVSRMEELVSEQKRVRGWLFAAVVTALLNLMALLAMWALGA